MRWFLTVPLLAVLVLAAAPADAQENLVSNPGFERVEGGFFADWGAGSFGKVEKTLFVSDERPHGGQRCLRMAGTPGTFTTCMAKQIPVKPDTNYWITWWFRAKQPASSRTYLFLQTNLGQRVFSHTDQRGDFEGTPNIVSYHTLPGETWIAPTPTMHTSRDEVGTSWWDDFGVWEKLPPDLERAYRESHPWDDVAVPTAQRYAEAGGCVVWGDRAEARIYPQTPVPADASRVPEICLVAPGRGHDVVQLVVSPREAEGRYSLRFTAPAGRGTMPAGTLSYRVARCVPVKEVRDKSFPLGPTPDPLVEPSAPEPARPGQSALFWIEWAPPPGGKAGVYTAKVEVLAGGKPIVSVPLRLRRWAFDLPELTRYRSMVMVSAGDIRRLMPGTSEEDAYRLAWDILSRYRLSGFNLALWPAVKLVDGKPEIDWARFDRIVAAAKQYHAGALTLGPMFGGGCSQGWQPSKLAGLTPLADPGFDALYADINRRMAERLRAAGMLERSYVYPYDEPEPDYMEKIAGLCDGIHKGAPDLKCLMTVSPDAAAPLYGKVGAWIVPSSTAHSPSVARRRAAGDEIWVYNMTAGIEETPLAHRLYLWHAFQVDAVGGLLWNCSWWNKINPWENPTAAAVAVGRQWESLYHYQAGEASLFYPDPAGKGPLVPSLRLSLIRQGVEDFDILSGLLAAWDRSLPRLPAVGRRDLAARARAALVAPVVLDSATLTTSQARAEAIRLLAGNQLEVAARRPAVVAYPARIAGKLGVEGCAEAGTRLLLNGKPVAVGKDGRFRQALSEEALAAGLRWQASLGKAAKSWEWPGLR